MVGRLLLLCCAISIAASPPALAQAEDDETFEEYQRIGALFSEGQDDEALERLAGLSGTSAKPDELTERSARHLVALVSVIGIGDPARERIYRLAVAAYARTLPIESLKHDAAILPLALWLMQQGRPADAEDVLRDRLAFYEACCANEQSRYLVYARLMFRALGQQERSAQARLLADRVWVVVDRLFGIDHPDTIRLANDRVAALIADGASNEANAFSAALLREARTNDVHDGFLEWYLVIRARTALAQGDLAVAETTTREAISLSGDDWDLAASVSETSAAMARVVLAETLEQAGRPDEAEVLRRELVAKIEKGWLYSSQNREHAAATLALALNLAAQEKTEALEALRRYTAARAETYGIRSPQVVEIAVPYARHLLAVGQSENALAQARLVLAGTIAAGARIRVQSGVASERRDAKQRKEAAILLVRTAWAVSSP